VGTAAMTKKMGVPGKRKRGANQTPGANMAAKRTRLGGEGKKMKKGNGKTSSPSRRDPIPKVAPRYTNDFAPKRRLKKMTLKGLPENCGRKEDGK